MNTAFVTIIAVGTIVSVNSQWDWCSGNANCSIDGKIIQNTMCSKNESTSNEHATKIQVSFEETDKQLFLSWHNTYRDKIAEGVVPRWPNATNMRQLTWDDDLQKLAQRWAFQTTYDHDECRRTEKFEKVGQNMAVRVGTGDSMLQSAFETWVNEILNTSPEVVVNNFIFENEWANFTNVIWAETYKVGCSAVNYIPKQDTYIAYTVVCNYGPESVNGSATYKRGKPCTACPKGTKCNPKSTHPNLCAFPEDPANEKIIFIGILPNHGMKNMIDYYSPTILLLITRLF